MVVSRGEIGGWQAKILRVYRRGHDTSTEETPKRAFFLPISGTHTHKWIRTHTYMRRWIRNARTHTREGWIRYAGTRVGEPNAYSTGTRNANGKRGGYLYIYLPSTDFLHHFWTFRFKESGEPVCEFNVCGGRLPFWLSKEDDII